MAKRKKPNKPEPKFPPPRNMSNDLEDMYAIESGCMSVESDDGSLLGVLTILTRVGHYDFMVDESTANEIIQHLRDLLSGEAEDFPLK